VFFTKFLVGPDATVTGAELTDEFGALLREELAERLESIKSKPRALHAVGSTKSYLVETAGIEPASAVAMRRLLQA
jgi:hypothetical protein